MKRGYVQGYGGTSSPHQRLESTLFVMGDKNVSRLFGILCKALLGRQLLPYQRPMVHTMCFHLSFATCT